MAEMIAGGMGRKVGLVISLTLLSGSLALAAAAPTEKAAPPGSGQKPPVTSTGNTGDSGDEKPATPESPLGKKLLQAALHEEKAFKDVQLEVERVLLEKKARLIVTAKGSVPEEFHRGELERRVRKLLKRLFHVEKDRVVVLVGGVSRAREPVSTRTFRLHYIRDAAAMAGLLNSMLGGGGGGSGGGGATTSQNVTITNSGQLPVIPNSVTTIKETTEKNVKTTTIENKPNKGDPSPPKFTAQSQGTDTILVIGPPDKVSMARRLLVTVDIPRAGVNLDLWGIQISSDSPRRLAEFLDCIRGDIDVAKARVRETFQRLAAFAESQIRPADFDPAFYELFTGQPLNDSLAEPAGRLAYTNALSADRPLSLTDILLRLTAARNAGEKNRQLANSLLHWLESDPDFGEEVIRRRKEGHPPFERFFRFRGLAWREPRSSGPPSRLNGPDGKVRTNPPSGWYDPELPSLPDRPGTPGPDDVPPTQANRYASMSRIALLRFALDYQDYVERPTQFAGYYLQNAADALNGRLQLGATALSLDIRDLFLTTTIKRIRDKVRDFDGVSFSQVGQTTLATLSGSAASVTGTSVNAIDYTPPLKLGDVVERANKISSSAGGFFPAAAIPEGLPAAQLFGLVAALGEDRTLWRELNAGVSLEVTPNILRDQRSAELELKIDIGSPEAGTREKGVPPLSRVSQHTVKTKVYVDSLDLFDFSTFSEQVTVDGGRSRLPIIGHIWQGIFNDIPVIGDLFSWKNSPKKRYHQSLILANSMITPTIIGVAYLYPTGFSQTRLDLSEEGGDVHYQIQRAYMAAYAWRQLEGGQGHLGPLAEEIRRHETSFYKRIEARVDEAIRSD